MAGSTPAEAAAEMETVNLAFFDRKPGCRGGCGERGLRVLGCGPDLTFVFRPARRGVHRLHGGMMLVGVVVHRLNCLRGSCQSSLHITLLVADEGLLCRESLRQHLRDGVARERGVGPGIPLDRKCVESGFRPPPGIGDHRNPGIFHRHHLLDARHALHLGGIEVLELATEDGAILDSRVQHARQLHIDAVNLPPV